MDRSPILSSARNTLFTDEAYHQLFEKSLAIQLLIDPESANILDANPAACSFYGYNRDAFIRLNVNDINTLSATALAAEMQLAKRDKRNFFRFRHCLSSGEERDVEVYSSPLEVGDKTVLHSIIIDVTPRITLEEQVEKTRVMLGCLMLQLEQAAAGVAKGEAAQHGNLSEREYEVMLLLAKGMNTHEIAARLFLDRSTIRTYRGRLNKNRTYARVI